MHNGDLVRINQGRYITYVDRKKDMINTGGESVYSFEIEEVLRRHDAVAEVAFVGFLMRSGEKRSRHWFYPETGKEVYSGGTHISLQEPCGRL